MSCAAFRDRMSAPLKLWRTERNAGYETRNLRRLGRFRGGGELCTHLRIGLYFFERRSRLRARILLQERSRKVYWIVPGRNIPLGDIHGCSAYTVVSQG